MSRAQSDGSVDRYGTTVPALLKSWTMAKMPAISIPPQFSGITADSNLVRAGDLFVAIRGTRVDGHEFIADAVAKGAAAIVVEDEASVDAHEGAVPIVRVADSQNALADLAAEWYGHPAASMRLVGITGTAGKTSTLAILATILTSAGQSVGTIGSLGTRFAGRTLEETGHTVPDPLTLHGEFARLRSEGASLVAMEVTSHALDQQRVAGLLYDLGIFTNLLPLEHSEYHGDMRGYVEAKSRFFDHIKNGSPLVYNADDQVVRQLVEDRDIRAIGCGVSGDATLRIEPHEVSAKGTRLTLHICQPLTRLDGSTVEPQSLELELKLLGPSSLENAALATTAALCLGVDPRTAAEAVAKFPPPSRRMEVVRNDRITILDDTVGHPDSISSLFSVVSRLPRRRTHAVYAVRGQRGTRVNRQAAEALAVWALKHPLDSLILTLSREAVDDRNRVEDDELEAFREPLRREGVEWTEHERLDSAVRAALDNTEDGDLLLLLGAQGMDRGAEIALRIG